MKLPTPDDLTAKLPEDMETSKHSHKLENLKQNLQKAYEIARENNLKAHGKNKLHYDQKTKERNFNVGDIVYLFCPAQKPG
jgi:hypothetical protein